MEEKGEKAGNKKKKNNELKESRGFSKQSFEMICKVWETSGGRGADVGGRDGVCNACIVVQIHSWLTSNALMR
jgi:hypothetical protein